MDVKSCDIAPGPVVLDGLTCQDLSLIMEAIALSKHELYPDSELHADQRQRLMYIYNTISLIRLIAYAPPGVT